MPSSTESSAVSDIDSLPLPLVVTDDHGVILECNTEALQIFAAARSTAQRCSKRSSLSFRCPASLFTLRAPGPRSSSGWKHCQTADMQHSIWRRVR